MKSYIKWLLYIFFFEKVGQKLKKLEISPQTIHSEPLPCILFDFIHKFFKLNSQCQITVHRGGDAYQKMSFYEKNSVASSVAALAQQLGATK